MATTRIREALELLDGGRRWTQHPRTGEIRLGQLRPNQRICVGIAINEVGGSSFDCRALKAVAREQWPERCGFNQMPGLVPHINDHPDTTWADIEVWMEKAAVMREESVEL